MADERDNSAGVAGAGTRSPRVLEAVLQSIRQGLLLADHTGHFLTINAAAASMLGYADIASMPTSMAELAEIFEARRADSTLLAPGEWPLARALAGQTVHEQELHVRRRDTGKGFIGSFSASRVDVPGIDQGLALLTMRELTHAKRAEAALRRSEERFRRLADNGSFGLVIADGRGLITYMNPALLRLLGYAPGDVTSGQLRFDALTPAEFQQLHDRAMSQVIATGRSLAHEQAYSTRDGRRVPVMVTLAVLEEGDGRDLVIAGYVLDLTPQRLAEAALRDNERRQRELLESLPQLVWTCTADGRCDYVSRQWVHYTGRPADDQIGWAWLQQVHPSDRDRVREAWTAAVLSGAQIDLELRIRRHDGEYRWFKTRATPIPDSTGKVVRWFGSSTDIDDHVRAKETLEREGQRKSEFLALLSHELRNPLAPIRNSFHVLERAPSGGEAATRARDVISRQLRHLERLVGDLLDLTRISSDKVQLHREKIDLAALVKRTVEDHASVFETAGISLRCLSNAGQSMVEGDETRLAQVFGNLLQNAARFTPSGGHVDVVVEPRPDPPQVVVRVIDDGAGMDSELIGRLFTPFAQGDKSLARSRGGLGLGLALVKGLVELHGGTVRASSSGIDKGSTFEVVLPAVELQTASERSEDALAPVDGVRRVLVIEDNIDAADSLRDLLELYGHKVEVAHDGYEGLRKAKQFLPEIVLCDIGLPQMDGYEVAAAFRADEQFASVRLVALTGYALREDQLKASAAGFDNHLAKPPDLKRLQAILADAPLHH